MCVLSQGHTSVPGETCRSFSERVVTDLHDCFAQNFSCRFQAQASRIKIKEAGLSAQPLKLRNAGWAYGEFPSILLVPFLLNRSLDQNFTSYCNRGAFSGTSEHSMARPLTFTRVIHRFVLQNPHTAGCFAPLKPSTSISPCDKVMVRTSCQ